MSEASVQGAGGVLVVDAGLLTCALVDDGVDGGRARSRLAGAAPSAPQTSAPQSSAPQSSAPQSSAPQSREAHSREAHSREAQSRAPQSGAPQSIVVPEAVDLRVGGVLARLVSTGRLSPLRAEQALADLADLPLERVPHWPFQARAWQLRDQLPPLGAVTVAIAEAYGAVLVVADRRFVVDGLRCRLELVSG